MKNSWWFILVVIICRAQTPYPAHDFIAPLPIPLQLSGNFGELRANHFHAGFDFKTNQKEGYPVVAAANGYVSRIKISAFGYGKALYISHPNGYTSVYGHLQKAVGQTETYIKHKQYELKQFEIDVFLKPDELPVFQGDTIALSGNTGGSDGPHLHFEIRDTKTEKIINPFHFGFAELLKDSKSPYVVSLQAYPIETQSEVNSQMQPFSLALNKDKSGDYISEILQVRGKIGLGIQAFDFDDVSYNSNGLYKVETFLNGQPHYSYVFDTFSFDETRHVNALLDYGIYKESGLKIQKLYRESLYPSSIISEPNSTGIIDVQPKQNSLYRIEISDFVGNKTCIQVPIRYASKARKTNHKVTEYNYLIRADRESIIEEDGFSVQFPVHSVYANVPMYIYRAGNEFHLHTDRVALQSPVVFHVKDSLHSPEQKAKMYLALVDGKKPKFVTSQITAEGFRAYVKMLGTYSLLTDELTPLIKPLKNPEGLDVTSWAELSFLISDEQSGISTYEGTLNGEWILFEYDAKTSRLSHQIADGKLRHGKNCLQLKVTDRVGNSAIFEACFTAQTTP
ncbi:MAG: peptidase M23 [Flavobacterium sp. BFFFF2]|nr:MAG: peptidase M23 [Flavobacterium sp. BFFFF2]